MFSLQYIPHTEQSSIHTNIQEKIRLCHRHGAIFVEKFYSRKILLYTLYHRDSLYVNQFGIANNIKNVFNYKIFPTNCNPATSKDMTTRCPHIFYHLHIKKHKNNEKKCMETLQRKYYANLRNYTDSTRWPIISLKCTQNNIDNLNYRNS